jgi:preprotein translocase subunit SecG
LRVVVVVVVVVVVAVLMGRGRKMWGESGGVVGW